MAPGVGAALLPLEVEEFLSWLAAERGRARNTLLAYRRDLRAYTAWLAEQGLTLVDADAEAIERYVAVRRASGAAPASVARGLVAVRSLHRFLADEGLAVSDPGAMVEAPSVPAGLPKALGEDEVAALLASVVGDHPGARRDRALLELLYGTGARISEAVGLSLGDLDLVGGLVRLLGKGGRERVVPLLGLAGDAMAEWLDDGPGGRDAVVPDRWARRGDAEAVFLNLRGGRLSRQGAWAVVRTHGERVGLGGRLSPHVLRHSCATHLVGRGADIRVVQELLGHARISTTAIYTKVSTERLRSAYDAAHPRARGRAGGVGASVPSVDALDRDDQDPPPGAPTGAAVGGGVARGSGS